MGSLIYLFFEEMGSLIVSLITSHLLNGKKILVGFYIGLDWLVLWFRFDVLANFDRVQLERLRTCIISIDLTFNRL